MKGSHHFLRQPGGRTTVVPVHGSETIGPGLFSKILRDVEFSRDQLEAFTHEGATVDEKPRVRRIVRLREPPE